jgi:hypothetical protein
VSVGIAEEVSVGVLVDVVTSVSVLVGVNAGMRVIGMRVVRIPHAHFGNMHGVGVGVRVRVGVQVGVGVGRQGVILVPTY